MNDEENTVTTAFKVGDRVRVPLGRSSLDGVITEDRGAIGYNGRRLYRVVVPVEESEPRVYELPEAELELIDPLTEPELVVDPARAEDYLTRGGLITILHTNVSGGAHQPRVWLRPNAAGNVLYTFDEARGVVGGNVVPSLAVHGERVFTPKRVEVLRFIQSFGFDRATAERIVAAVGTAP